MKAEGPFFPTVVNTCAAGENGIPDFRHEGKEIVKFRNGPAGIEHHRFPGSGYRTDSVKGFPGDSLAAVKQGAVNIQSDQVVTHDESLFPRNRPESATRKSLEV